MIYSLKNSNNLRGDYYSFCEKGYGGPLCSACENGYSQYMGNSCVACQSPFVSMIFYLLFFVFLTTVVGFYVL